MAKILIDARMYGLENSGIGRYTINLLENLAKKDVQNSYVVLLKQKYFNEVNFPKNWKKVLTNISHYSVKEQMLLPHLIQKEKPDLVHFLHLNVPLGYRGKYVVTFHDLIMHRQGIKATTLPLPFYYAKRVPYKVIAKNAALKSVIIITPSFAVKNEVSSYYKIPKEKIKVTYEGISKKFKTDSRDKGELETLSEYGLKANEYFFYIGNAYPHKNLEIAVKAVKKYNLENNKNFKFAIGGARDVFRNRLEEYVTKNEAKEFCHILGYIPDDALPILYRNAIGFIYPSLSEGFGLQGLEAISSGTLLLASDIPVFREIYKDNAIYFDPFSVDSLVTALAKSINLQVNEKANIIEKANAYIKRYSWEKTAEDTLKIYREALQ